MFGRCSTSQRSGNGGDCNKMSHQIKCCDSDSKVNQEKCGWIYGKFGTKQQCPGGNVVAGFCGVNNKADCPHDTYVGIYCCQAGIQSQF